MIDFIKWAFREPGSSLITLCVLGVFTIAFLILLDMIFTFIIDYKRSKQSIQKESQAQKKP